MPEPESRPDQALRLAEQLAELSRSMSPSERSQILSRLAHSGFSRIPGPSDSWILPPDQSGLFREVLSLDSNAQLDGPRLSELAAAMARFVSSLDQLAWNTWAKVAPRSDVTRVAPIGRLIGQYATGQTDDAELVKREVERLRVLIAALLGAMGQVGHFAHRRLEELSPDLIEANVGGSDAKSWRRYRELVGEFDESATESSMLESVAEYAESMLRDA